MLAAIAALFLLQAQEAKGRLTDNFPAPTEPARTTTKAARTVRPLVIDGRADEEAWRDAPAITEFVEFDPVEGKAARFRTEARVAYDQRNFYVFVRMYDPEPQKILKLLARRDQRAPTDQIKIIIDSYHDRRSGYSFAVNPAGVLRDYAIYDDRNEDGNVTHPQRFDGGLDFKYGVSSNLTLDGTINPDFGQIEADPAVLNLSAFETFFQERRPFFIEGAGLLSFSVNCYIVRDCGSENLFYSRRIGRAPQLSGLYGDAASPTGTTILGATKLTGRAPGGFSLGVLDAVTARETGPDDRTIEPTSNYAVVRATQDFRRGESGIGVIGTLVNRSLDQWTRDGIRGSAVVGGMDFRHRFNKGRFQLNASVVGSRVAGSAAAIDATQRSSVHFYQRPDGELDYDPTRTSLTGHSAQVRFAKFGGGKLRFETSYQRISPGFEANDLGFLRRADWQSQAAWAALNFNKPGPFYRRLFWNFNEELQWNTSGLPLDRWVNSNVHFELPNSWWVRAGGSLGGLGTVYCDRCARGGPALRGSQYFAPWGGIQGDSRWVVVPGLWFNYWRTDGGRSRNYSVSPSLDFRVSSRFTSSLGLNFSNNRDDRQWYGNPKDAGGVTHYTFAHLEQRTTSLRGRINFTATPTLTVQAYAEPFVSKGVYSDVRELDDPRAASYDARFKPYTTGGEPGGFNFKQFRSNIVLRWEYRPGSALYLVWQQGRQDSEGERGTRGLFGDLDRLFGAHPDNTFLVKLSYWLDR